MNCETLISSLGYSCSRLSEDLLRLTTPYTYYQDGELIDLYLKTLSENKYRLSDVGNTLFHAKSMDCNLDKSRLKQLFNLAGQECIELTDEGELFCIASTQDLSIRVAEMIQVLIKSTSLEESWLSPMKNESFTDIVGYYLDSCSSKIQRNVKVTGSSGHQLSFPFTVQAESGLFYIQPVSSRENKLNWNSVHAAYGKMAEIAEIDCHRLVVLDDSCDVESSGQALTFLSGVSEAVLYSGRSQWGNMLAA